jgi:hypothetical protein
MPYGEETMSATKNAVESFRDVVQDLLVPELKAVKVSVDSLHSEMSYLRTEIKLRDEKMEQLVRTGDEKNEQAIRTLSQKLDFAIDIRERLASLEARVPRQ